MENCICGHVGRGPLKVLWIPMPGALLCLCPHIYSSGLICSQKNASTVNTRTSFGLLCDLQSHTFHRCVNISRCSVTCSTYPRKTGNGVPYPQHTCRLHCGPPPCSLLRWVQADAHDIGVPLYTLVSCNAKAHSENTFLKRGNERRCDMILSYDMTHSYQEGSVFSLYTPLSYLPYR